MPYNKPLTNLACSGRTGEYWPSVVAVRTERKQGITHQIGSELIEFFVVSIAVFSVHISEAFESLQIPPPPPLQQIQSRYSLGTWVLYLLLIMEYKYYYLQTEKWPG